MSLFFSVVCCSHSNSNTESQRKAGKEAREGEMKSGIQGTESESQAAFRKPVGSLVHPDFPYRSCSLELPADNRFSQIPAGSAPQLPRRSSETERSINSCECVCENIHVCLCVSVCVCPL